MKEKHYHYMFTYFYSLNKQRIAVARIITNIKEISNRVLVFYEKYLKDEHKKIGQKVEDLGIIDFKELECDCDE